MVKKYYRARVTGYIDIESWTGPFELEVNDSMTEDDIAELLDSKINNAWLDSDDNFIITDIHTLTYESHEEVNPPDPTQIIS